MGTPTWFHRLLFWRKSESQSEEQDKKQSPSPKALNMNLLDQKWEVGFSNKKLVVGTFEPRTKLSKYFRFYEMVKSQTADNSRILNQPTPEEIQNAIALAENVLDKARAHFGVINVNSWFRCEELEREIASTGFTKWLYKNGLARTAATWSRYFNRKQHPKGSAADIEAQDPNVSNQELYNWIRDNCEFDQLILEHVTNTHDPRSGWVHVSVNPDPRKNRKQAFYIND